MASQLMLANQIAEIKAALKRKPYDSDSDESITHDSNRGQKLRKRARYTTRGQLAPAQVYREEIEYAGVKRRIIARNPTPVDDEGYMVDGYCSDERQQEARANVADLNPYSSVHLERILAPLTSVTDLPDHPTLSTPFRSRTIAELSGQASELMRREQKSLWKVRKLMTGLCGDFTWLPCGPLVGPNDVGLFADDSAPQERRRKRPLLPEPGNSTPMANGDKNVSLNGSSGAATGPPSDSAGERAQAGDDVPMADGPRPDTNGETRPSGEAGKEKSPSQQEPHAPPRDAVSDKNPETEASAMAETPATQEPGGSTDKATNPEGGREDGTDPDKTIDMGMQYADQADATHAEAPEQQDASGRPPADPADEAALIHPFFHPPAYPLPDRDLGLPENEAENVRHLMSLYVQKQEEVARGAARLHEGLMKADRLRATVLEWAKAEAHVGELSDGEDWYDREEWGLEEELSKGVEEEEEDTVQPVKKTRNRRQ